MILRDKNVSFFLLNALLILIVKHLHRNLFKTIIIQCNLSFSCHWLLESSTLPPSLSGHPVSADSVLTYSHYSIIINMVYKTNLTGGRLSPKTHHNRRGASFLALQFRSLRRPFARPSLSQWIDFYLITINIHLEVDHTIKTIQCSIPFDNRDNSPFLIFPTFISPLRNFTKFRLSWLYRLPSFLNPSPLLNNISDGAYWRIDRLVDWLIVSLLDIQITEYGNRSSQV